MKLFESIFKMLKVHVLTGCALFILLMVGCQSQDNQVSGLYLQTEDMFIFGGEKLRPNDELAAFVVGLRFEDDTGDTQICTGSWIAQDWILTAAHCIPTSQGLLSVLKTNNLLNAGVASEQALTLKRTIIHPRAQIEKQRLILNKQWQTGNRFDIALIQVRSPSEGHQWFRLEQALPSSGRNLIFRTLGFGHSHYDVLTGQKEGGGELQHAVLGPSMPSENGVFYISQSSSTGICVGDSGAPLALSAAENGPLTLVGVASSVRNPGSPNVCGGTSNFVDIRALKPWILQQIANSK